VDIVSVTENEDGDVEVVYVVQGVDADDAQDVLDTLEDPAAADAIAEALNNADDDRIRSGCVDWPCRARVQALIRPLPASGFYCRQPHLSLLSVHTPTFVRSGVSVAPQDAAEATAEVTGVPVIEASTEVAGLTESEVESDAFEVTFEKAVANALDIDPSQVQ